MSRSLPPASLLSVRHWPVWLGIALGWSLAHWPWWLARRAGSLWGKLMYLGMIARRRVARRNIALCFPELSKPEQDRLLHANFDSLGIATFEFVRAWWGRLGPLDPLDTLDGLDRIRSIQASGRGVILLSPHFTTLEICGRMLCRHIDVAVMHRPHDSPALEWAINRGRQRYIRAQFSRDELRPAVRHLKNGGLLWFAPDQETRRGDSVFVPFFGVPAWSLISTHQLAKLTGAAVLPLFHERLGNGHYRLEIGPPMADFPGPDATGDTARVMALLESLIRRVPAQYLWIHQRFKRQPDGRASPYQ